MRLLVVLLLGTAGLGWGTTCGPQVFGPLCQQVPENAILFFGTMVEKAPPMQGHWSRFAVKEIFQGLPPGTTEVLVFPGGLGEFRLGGSYLLTADHWKTYSWHSRTWDRLKWWWEFERHWPPLIRLQTWSCAYLREHFRVPQEDWAYARELRDGKPRRRIYGTVSLGGALWRGGTGLPPLAGAMVGIHGPTRSWSVAADENGQYSVEGVDPGKYWLEAEAPGYSSKGETLEFELNPRGCRFAPLAMTAAGTLAGRVVQPDGSPAKRASVWYRFADPKWRGQIEESSTTTNERGEFSWNDVPPGEFVVEVRAFGSDDPYTTMRLKLGLNEVRQGIVFRLAPTPPKRVVTVRVSWPDGRPAQGIAVFGESGEVRSERLITGADGIAKLPVFAGRRYSVFASVPVDGKWTGAGRGANGLRGSGDREGTRPISLG